MLQLPAWLMMNIYTAILLILLIYFNGRSHQKSRQSTAFRTLLFLLLSILFWDSLRHISGENAVLINRLLRLGNFMVFSLDPICYCAVILYIESCADMETHSLLTKLVWFPMIIINFALLLFSELYDLRLFYYIEGGIYYRGSFYFLRAVVMLSQYFFLELFIYLHRKDFLPSYFVPLNIFPALVFIFTMMQLIFPGMNLQYMGITLSCLLLFFYIQNRDANEDYLTSVSNRRGLYNALNYAITDRRNPSFAVIMLDIDHFKSINDQYGHKAGDQALVDLAEILRSFFRRNDTIGRFGGDEFCVLLYLKRGEDLDRTLQRLRASIVHFNRTHDRPYTLRVSLGAAVYDQALWDNEDSFLSYVDEQLYEEKRQHHSRTELAADII